MRHDLFVNVINTRIDEIKAGQAAFYKELLGNTNCPWENTYVLHRIKLLCDELEYLVQAKSLIEIMSAKRTPA